MLFPVGVTPKGTIVLGRTVEQQAPGPDMCLAGNKFVWPQPHSLLQ